jgi:hypothetical protein
MGTEVMRGHVTAGLAVAETFNMDTRSVRRVSGIVQVAFRLGTRSTNAVA